MTKYHLSMMMYVPGEPKFRNKSKAIDFSVGRKHLVVIFLTTNRQYYGRHGPICVLMSSIKAFPNVILLMEKNLPVHRVRCLKQKQKLKSRWITPRC